MDKKLVSVILSLAAVLVFFVGIALIGPRLNPSLQLDQTALLRFVFVAVGLVIVFVVYYLTRTSNIWEVGTRQSLDQRQERPTVPRCAMAARGEAELPAG